MISRPALVFDLDDTLYPECDYVRSGFKAVDRWLQDHLNITGFEGKACSFFESGARGNIFDLALHDLGHDLPAALLKELVTVYRAHNPQISLFPDADWALSFFRSHFQLAVLTDGYLQTQENKIGALGLSRRVDTIVISDRYGREHWKPSPLPYSKVVEALGCQHAHCIYVADNIEKDFVTAKTLGWHTIQIIRPRGEYCSRVRPPDYHAAATVSDLYQLQGLLAGLTPKPS